VDTNSLPDGSFDYDAVPDGHVSVYASPGEIQAAIIDGGPNNFLEELGLKPLTDPGAYRLPK
jgi:hypothetical protein